jgi:transposase-like protein
MENVFKWRRFEPEMIVLCVRWYLRYALSYRDLEEMIIDIVSALVEWFTSLGLTL